MLDFCKELLNLFLLPYQEVFVESVFGSVFYIFLVFIPFLFLIKLIRRVF